MTWRIYSIIVLLPIIVVTVVATVRPLQWLLLVPDPMATHFDADGNPDGFSAPITSIALIAGINLVVIIAVAVALRLKFLTGPQGRFLSGSAAFTVVLISVLQIELFKSQTSLTVATDALLPMSIMGMAFGFATIAGLSIGLVPTPAPSATHDTAPEQSPKPSTPDDLTWRSVEMMHPGVQLVVLLAIAIVIGFVSLAPGWISLVIAGLTVLLVIATWGWRLRIDETGFSYAGFLGFPRGNIPHAAIASAEVTEIRPGQWGGWGWRVSATGTGLITRAGAGVRITRTNGKVLEASTQDAATAVTLINHYRQDASVQHNCEPPTA